MTLCNLHKTNLKNCEKDLGKVKEHIQYAKERQDTCYMRGDLKFWRAKKKELMQQYPFCWNSRKWLGFLASNPATCPYPLGNCEGCGYYEERKANAYLKRKDKVLKFIFGKKEVRK